MNTCISAVQHLRPLRGGAQAHLLRASDGASYVTKFQNNPQHIRVLANEMLATNLGLALGLPMPRVEVIEVSDWLIEQTEDLRIQLGWFQDSMPERQAIGIAVRGLRESWHDASTTCLANCCREFSILGTSLGFLSWTSGRATAMEGRQSSVGKPCEASDTTQPSLTRATASMPASGVSRTVRSEVYTRTIVFTRVSWDGRHSNQH